VVRIPTLELETGLTLTVCLCQTPKCHSKASVCTAFYVYAMLCCLC